MMFGFRVSYFPRISGLRAARDEVNQIIPHGSPKMPHGSPPACQWEGRTKKRRMSGRCGTAGAARTISKMPK